MRLFVVTSIVLIASIVHAQTAMFDGAADPEGVRTFLQNFNPDAEKRREIQSLIEQLDSARFATRRSALRELSTLPLIPASILRTAEIDAGAEVRAALGYLRRVHSDEINDLRLRSAFLHIERCNLKGQAELILAAIPNTITRETKSAASVALQVTATPDDEVRLSRLLDDPSPYLRRAAAIALAAGSGKTVMPAISKLLDDPHTLVRLAAAETMLNLEQHDALPVLVEFLRAPQLLPRWRSACLLRAATGQAFNFSATADEKSRTLAADRWQQWVQEHGDHHPLTVPVKVTGYIPLLNGTDLAGWHAFDEQGQTADDHWTVTDGVLVCRYRTRGYLRTADVFSDYRLVLEWRNQSAAGDSGVGILVQPGMDRAPVFLEVQLHTANAGDLYQIGNLKATVNGQPLAIRANKRHKSNERYQKWNSLAIIVRNKSVAVFINGLLQNEATVETDSGHIALRNESSVVEFRNVRLIPLESESNLNPARQRAK